MFFSSWESYAHQSPAFALVVVILVAISHPMYRWAYYTDHGLVPNWYFQLILLVAGLPLVVEGGIEIHRFYQAWSSGIDMFTFPRGARSMFNLLFGFAVPIVSLVWPLWMFALAQIMVNESKKDPFAVKAK